MDKNLTPDGKNQKSVICPDCSSVILLPKSAEYVNKQEGLFLPFTKVKKQGDKGDSNNIEGEKLQEFWSVNNMFTFENVGFCNTLNNVKYLACADCEVGPIGAHLPNTQEFYVSLQRTKEA